MSDENVLTKEIVEQYLKDEDAVDLKAFTAIEADAAETLSKHGGQLELSGLENLSDAAAEHFSQHKRELFLYGLTSLSDAAAESLSKHEGELGLGSLRSLSDAAAKSLSKHEGELDLIGLRSLSNAAVENLIKHKGELHLYGPTAAAANNLSKRKEELDLPWASSLTSNNAFFTVGLVAVVSGLAAIFGWFAILSVIAYFAMIMLVGVAGVAIVKASSRTPVKWSRSEIGIVAGSVVAFLVLAAIQWLMGWGLFFWLIAGLGGVVMIVVGIAQLINLMRLRSKAENQSSSFSISFGLLLSGLIIVGITACDGWLSLIQVTHWIVLAVCPILAAVAAGRAYCLRQTATAGQTQVVFRIAGVAAMVCVTMILSLIGQISVSTDDGPETPFAPPQAELVPPPAVLVIIVPGTFGNSDFWPTVTRGRGSFASEVLDVLGSNSEVYPFLWSAPNEHRARVQAASNLSEIIDDKSAHFDRVCIVAHSHGGNIALLAAAGCKTTIDTVVCLSTPHLHLKTIHPQKGRLTIPVYCSPTSLTHVKHIVSIVPDTDTVMDGWANIFTGMEENEAIRLTREWREANDNPRLLDDSADFIVFRTPLKNVFASQQLAVKRAVSVVYHSLVQDGVKAHNCVHSRRMGQMVGELLKDGPTPSRLAFIRTFLQPSYSDTGEPITADRQGITMWDILGWGQRSFLTGKEPWRLTHATLECVGDGKRIADDLDGSSPDLRLRGFVNKQTVGSTPLKPNSDTAEWRNTSIVAHSGATLRLVIVDEDVFSETPIEEFEISVGKSAVQRFIGDPDKGTYWNANFTWQKLHY
jgi:hypothetical protein